MKKKAGSQKKVIENREELARKQMGRFLEGRSVWCVSREQQIDPKVCENVQKTAGCQANDCQFWDSALAAKSTGKPKSKSSKPRKASYQTLMRAVFDEKGMATLDELVKVTGADAKNTSVGVSILRNPKRMKNPMKIAYHRPSKTYFNLDNKDGAEHYESAERVHDRQKKAVAKAKREAKKVEEKKISDKIDKDLEKIKPAKKTTKKATLKAKNPAKK